jgi:putative serine/threonine protein kinase
MAERESGNLALANTIGIGPRLLGKDLKRRLILMEFIEGPCFSEWLFSNPAKKQLKAFVAELQRQARALDKLGLDHGQLAGRGKNILVKKTNGPAFPVIIDFEKASTQRKCHNANTIEAFLFRNPNSAITKKVKEILEKQQ